MVGNAWSNAGLVSEGVDTAHGIRNDLAVSDIGLAELTRQSNDAGKLRSVTAANADKGVHELALARAHQQYQAGDHEGASKSVQEAQSAVEQAKDGMLTGAHNGMQPDQVEAQITRLMGKGAVVPGSIQYSKDPTTGHVLVTMKDGKSGANIDPIDATNYVQSQMKAETLKPGEILVKGGATVASNPVEDKPMTVPENSRVYIPGKGFVGGSGAADPNIGKQLPVLKEIADAVLSHPGMSEMDITSGKPMPTEAGVEKATLANQVYLGSGGKLDPQTAAIIAVKGKPKMNQSTGERAVEYQGKLYKRELTAGATAPAAPVAQPAPQAAQPTVQQPAAQPEAKYDQIARILAPNNVTPYEEKMKMLMDLQPNRSAPQSEQKKWQAALVKLKAMNAQKQPISQMQFAKGGKVSKHGIA